MMVITKVVYNLMNKMAVRLNTPLKVIAINANGVWRQPYELSRQPQDLLIDVALFSGTHLKTHERVFVPNYHFYGTDCFPGRKRGTDVAVRERIPHVHADLLPLDSIKVTWVCILMGNSEVQLATVYKSPGHACNDAEIAEFLSFRHTHKSLLAADLNAKHPLWNSAISNHSGAKLLNLLHINVLNFIVTVSRSLRSCAKW